MKLVWRTPEAETEFFAASGKEKVHPYRQMLIAQQAQKFSAAELARARKWIAEAHDRLFRSGLPAGLQIQLLLTKLFKKPLMQTVRGSPVSGREESMDPQNHQKHLHQDTRVPKIGRQPFLPRHIFILCLKLRR